MSFKTGDKVRLASGGPDMMVDELDRSDGAVHCYWFAGDELREGVFDCRNLIAAPKSASYDLGNSNGQFPLIASQIEAFNSTRDLVGA